MILKIFSVRWGRGLRLLGLVAAALGTPSCRNSTDTGAVGEAALVGTMDGDPFLVADLGSGKIIARPSSGVGALGEESRALSTPAGLLFYSGGGNLVAFDLATRAISWQAPIGGGQSARWAGQSIYASYCMALSPDGKRLLAADAYLLGIVGVGIVDLSSKSAAGFLPHLRARKMFSISPGELAPTGGVLALGTTLPVTYDDDTERRRGKLYLLTGAPAVVSDSIDFLSAEDSLAGGVAEMVVDRAGHYAYFTTYNNKVQKYDLIARSYVASSNLPAFGPLVMSADGSVIYVIDASQSRDVASSGGLYVLDGNLRLIRTLDLKAASRDGLPPQLNTISLSKDEGTILLGSGTPSRGPIYGVQHGSIVVVDAETYTVKHVFELTSWGVRSILPL